MDTTRRIWLLIGLAVGLGLLITGCRGGDVRERAADQYQDALSRVGCSRSPCPGSSAEILAAVRGIEFPPEARADADRLIHDLTAWTLPPGSRGADVNAGADMSFADQVLRRDLGLQPTTGAPGVITSYAVAVLLFGTPLVARLLPRRRRTAALIAAGTFGLTTGTALLVAAATWFRQNDKTFWPMAALGGVLAVLGAAQAVVGSIHMARRNALVCGAAVGILTGVAIALTSDAPTVLWAALAASVAATSAAIATGREKRSSLIAVAIGCAGALLPIGMLLRFGQQAWVVGTLGDAVAVASVVVAAAVTAGGGRIPTVTRERRPER